MKLLLLVAALSAAFGQQNRLVVSQRSEPRTFNPVFAVDAPTRDLLRLLHGRLVRIDGDTLETQPSLASKWKFSPDGRSCTLELRRDVRFSDGHPFDAGDVLFSFEVYQDPRIASPQRDLLAPNGKPVRLTRISSHTVRVDFAEPHAPGERLFDGIAILPRHRLETAYRAGTLPSAWNLAAAPAEMAGLGPFILERMLPGQRIVLKRNPNYWQSGAPKLDTVEIVFAADQTAEVLRFRNGEIDLLQRPPARAFRALAANAATVDRGASLEYYFLFFNMNAGERLPASLRAKQEWFRTTAFRRAVSLAADRAAMAKVAFDGLATPLAHHVTPGNRNWVDRTVPPRHSLAEARTLLRNAGFRAGGGILRDAAGNPVEFTIAVNAANASHVQVATLLQQDLSAIGIGVRIVQLEFRSLVDRILKTLEYDAAIMALGSGDADPNSEMNVWRLGGSMHVWNLSAKASPQPWEAEIDTLMEQQRSAQAGQRKRIYARVQQLVAEHLPIVPLVSPHLLVAHKRGLRGVRPSLVPPYALWNIEEFSWVDTLR